MRRQGYRVSLREIDAWVASFRHDPMVSDAGFARGWDRPKRFVKRSRRILSNRSRE
jgi:hypothetical protein